MKQLSVHEAKAHFSALMKEVEEGQVIVVTRHDKPIMEMRAVGDRKVPRLGTFAGCAPMGEVTWTDEELSETFGELFDDAPIEK